MIELRNATCNALLRSEAHLLRRFWLRNVPPRQSRLEVWIAAGVLAAMAWSKLFWWDDPVTLLAGIGAAALLASVSGWAGGRRSAD